MRTTIRSLKREDAVRTTLADAGMVGGERLSFAAADLTADAGWAEVLAGVDYVLHVASPVQPGHVRDANELIVPAREGTLRVLRAARDAGVRRVVLTSAFHAVGWGHPHDDHVFTEDDRTVVDGPGVDAYGASKTLAERAAWDLMAADGGPLELTTMLPVALMGSVVGRDVSGSNQVVLRILNGDLPGFPDIYIPIVDVRDVAAAHILAMTAKDAAGERFLLSAGPAIAMKQIGASIKAHLGDAAGNVPTRSIPDVVVRLGALFSAELRATAPDLGYARWTSNEKACRMLAWRPRDPEEAIVAAAKSLVAKDLTKQK